MLIALVGHHAGNLVFGLSAAVDAAVVIAAVVWALRNGRSGWRLVPAFVAVLVLLAIKGIVLVLAGVEVGFGVMHVLWLDLVVVGPIAGLALLVVGRRSSRAVRALGRLALRLAPVGAYASLVEPEPLVTRVRVRDRRLTIGGVELAHHSRAARELAVRLERAGGAGDVRLLLARRPDVLLALRQNTRIDLVIARHTHGGQLQLPVLGPLHTASRLPRRVGAGGLHALSGRRVYVSRGVGVERAQAPKLRLGAPPEVSLITLR